MSALLRTSLLLGAGLLVAGVVAGSGVAGQPAPVDGFRPGPAISAYVMGVGQAELRAAPLPWFRLLGVLLLTTAVWAAYGLRVRTLRAREAALAREVRERTRDLAMEKERAEEALHTVAVQAEKLRALDEAKSRFIANVSHEFRTPLSLILGPLRDLGERGDLTVEDRDRVELAFSNGERLAGLVDQLLDIVRLEAGTLALHLEVADLVPLLRRTAAAFESIARSGGRSFTVRLPRGPAYVAYDADHLDKVANNLLSNAFKFTEPGGSVRFEAWREGVPEDGWLVLRVQDDGPGIPTDELDRIFERFHQVDDSSSRRHGGVGLGLALSRDLVELHHGRITVTSGLGQGAVFEVRLPLRHAPTRGRRELRPEPPGPPQAPGPGQPAGGPDVTTVLLVEDNHQLRAYIRGHLERSYHVVEAPDAEAALAAVRQGPPDLIVSDVMMPGMDGFELCAAVRADPDLAFLPVILLTARASRESRLTGLAGGADDYVTKPFNMGELEARIHNLLQSRRRLRERFREEGRALPSLRPPWRDARLEDEEAELMARIHEVLVDHLGDEEFQVDDLARALHMSRSTLYRRLRDLLGESPMHLVWSYRLEQAAQWLRETDANVSEVAYDVGFKSVAHFSRRFRQRFGRSPAAFRDADTGQAADDE